MFRVNHLDIAPQHASVTMGISNTFATIPGKYHLLTVSHSTNWLCTRGSRIVQGKADFFSRFKPHLSLIKIYVNIIKKY